MLSWNATQTSIMGASSKRVTWLFTASGSYWSTKVVTYALQAYEARIIPESFDGIELNRSMSEYGIQAPSELRFSVSNTDASLDPATFIDNAVQVDLVVSDWTNETIIATWKFIAIRVESVAKELQFICEDFISQYLEGDYPNTEYVTQLAPSTDHMSNDNLCVPVPFGTSYIPVRSLFITDARYYVLGPDAPTYTISEVRSPDEWGSASIWASPAYTMTQATKTLGGADYKVFTPIIADSDNDGTADATGLFMQGERMLDIMVKFSRDDLAATTDPADVISYVLQDFGIAAGDIDTATTFAAAKVIYSGWGLTFNGAFFYKRPRREVLAMLLTMCHSCLRITNKVELHVLSKTSKKTLTTSLIAKSGKTTSFKYNPIIQDTSDYGYVLYGQADLPQTHLIKVKVSPEETYTQSSGESVELQFIQDSEDGQKAGILYYQRKIGTKARISLEARDDCVALQPDDVITIDNAVYGGTYIVLIDRIRIARDLSVSIDATRFKYTLDDWGDVAPSAVTPGDDVSTSIWRVVISGPGGGVSGGNAPNIIPGELRVGAGTDYILIDPVDLNIRVYDDSTEIARFGNLDAFTAEYTSPIYGFGVYKDEDNYIYADPVNGVRIAASQMNAIGTKNINSYGGINAAAVALAGTATPVTVLIADSQTMTANASFNQYVQLLFESEGIVNTTGDAWTLTVYSPANILTTTNQQIITGSGTLAFSSGGERVYTDWWGKTGAAINLAITAASATGIGEVILPGETIEPTVGILLKIGITLKGARKMERTSTFGTIIKPTNAPDYAIYNAEGDTDGWGIENILVDMVNMKDGAYGIFLQGGADHGNIRSSSVINLPPSGVGLYFYPTTTAGIYSNTIQDLDIQGDTVNGTGIKTSRELTATSRFNANTFMTVRVASCNVGWDMDATGSGNVQINCLSENNASDGVIYTNVASGSAPQWIGGEISANGGWGVNGVCLLYGTTLSNNTSGAITNGASLLDPLTTSDILTFSGGFKPSKYTAFGTSATQTLAAADAIDPTYSIALIQSDGGAVTLTSDPQITDGTVTGQFLMLRGLSNTNYPIIVDGQGLSLKHDWIAKLDEVLVLFWNAVAGSWIEVARSSDPYLVLKTGATQTLAAASTIDPCNSIILVKATAAGGAITLTSNPQITDGTANGQLLIIRGTDSTDYPIIVDGQGVRLCGNWEGKLENILVLFWSISANDWVEIARSTNSFLLDTTAAGAGTDGTISSRNANALGECTGFIKINGHYVPYWDDITP